jgi:osmotically-inducible protein OsmY
VGIAGILAIGIGPGIGTAKVARAAQTRIDETPAIVTPDQNLINKVSNALADDPALTLDQFTVEASQGVVELTGSAGSYSQHDRAIKDARRVEGVIVVKDNITVIQRDF